MIAALLLLMMQSGPPPVAVAPPAPPAPRPLVITNPQWIRKPNGDDLTGYYPTSALERGVEGHTVVECVVTEDGLLAACRVISEEPAGEGFGAAGVQAASLFRMRPQTVNGVPVSGARVRVPLTWRVVADDPAPTGVAGLTVPKAVLDRGITAEAYGARVRTEAIDGDFGTAFLRCDDAAAVTAETRPLTTERFPGAVGQPAFLERVVLHGCWRDSPQSVVTWLDARGGLNAFPMPAGASRAGPGLTARIRADLAADLAASPPTPGCAATMAVGEVTLAAGPDRLGRWKELWPVKSCGRSLLFEVTLAPGRPRGEVLDKVRRLPDPPKRSEHS